MQDFWIDFGISVVISTLRASIKNPTSKENMRKAFRKVYDYILLVYPEFADETIDRPTQDQKPS